LLLSPFHNLSILFLLILSIHELNFMFSFFFTLFFLICLSF